MSLVDVLLNSDVDEILAEKTEEYEVERLSKVLGEKFVLTLKSIPAKRYSEFQTTAINIKGKSKNIDLYKMQMLTLNEGIKNQIWQILIYLKSLMQLLRLICMKSCF